MSLIITPNKDGPGAHTLEIDVLHHWMPRRRHEIKYFHGAVDTSQLQRAVRMVSLANSRSRKSTTSGQTRSASSG